MKIKRTKKIIETVKNIKALAGLKVMAGWIDPEQKHDDTKLTMPQLAMTMEYGAKAGRDKKTIIPPRPALRISARKHGREWVKQAGELGKAVLEGKNTTENAAEFLGALVADDIKGTINKSSLFAPNAPSVIKRKGKNSPLIDTGELRDAVDYKIIGGNK